MFWLDRPQFTGMPDVWNGTPGEMWNNGNTEMWSDILQPANEEKTVAPEPKKQKLQQSPSPTQQKTVQQKYRKSNFQKHEIMLSMEGTPWPP